MKQLLKFIAAGIVNTLFGYSVYAGLLYIGVNYLVASTAATVLGIVFNWQTYGRLVFSSSARSMSGLLRFVTTYAVIWALNSLGLYLCAMFHMNLYWAGILLIPPTALLSFLLQKYFVFKGCCPQ